MIDLCAKGQPCNFKTEILSGLTVALALVPEAIAFAFVAQVDPLVGLYAAFIVGLITATIGGRPGMISGATGALAVIMTGLVVIHGVEYLFAAVVLMGIIQIIFGLLRLGKFIRLVPHPVMLGFVNGLAIVIFLAQIGQFKIPDPQDGNAVVWMQGSLLWTMMGLIALTMMIIHFLPKYTKAIPAPLAGILVVSTLVIVFGLPARTVGDIASIAGGFPEFHIPMIPMSSMSDLLETFVIIIPYSLAFAAIGLTESLLTLTVIDEMTETRGRGNKECVGQGVANITSGFFGSMGGCAMIGQSMINVNSGGRGRVSGIAAALFLLSFIMFASELISKIPLAALVGVMFMVVIGTFEWSSFRILGKIPKSDAFILISVSAITVVTDNLAIAVIIGVIIAALVFAWNHAKHITVNITRDNEDSKVYELHGPLFFGSVHNFQELFDPKNDPDDVVVEFKYSRVSDHSAIEAIDTLAERYLSADKRLHLRHVSPECRKLLKKAGGLCEVNVIEDPTYSVADDDLA
ncbi:MAG: SulP family inorganic anion transporter [gamma proteobacterium symbiont of Bathyaustriella thionipta]|nr:SulP family inorganic anion transporter [gamma proteobacterium symbiont of Bathyaustriella thionipta]MCU7950654.1 SulP family inorganic anion transporter [gamma proteobacterium symbiont of Bathyaustriella thionipta]MCU7953746.1 SulP family inorganic anion transporter [gamma proteobacterium symbiont of Bathyaustriella thionipta]MCU7957145.1 SulP family inorganic anion transporter [gamma proteobacterium symbiont of Bathyaustriella thionipta]MCU7968442.1 SulP family inorganic anion transporter 